MVQRGNKMRKYLRPPRHKNRPRGIYFESKRNRGKERNARRGKGVRSLKWGMLVGQKKKKDQKQGGQTVPANNGGRNSKRTTIARNA